MRCLDSSELTELEKALCSAEGIGELARDTNGKPVRVKSCKKSTSSVQQDNEDTEKIEKMQEGSGETGDRTVVQTQAETARIRSAFKNSADLLHRLFVAVSGIADQLQSNHARDLRLVLKGTFAVCEDPVPVRKNIDACGDIVPAEVVSEPVGDEMSGELCETQCGPSEISGKKRDLEGHFSSGGWLCVALVACGVIVWSVCVGESDGTATMVNVSERASVQGEFCLFSMFCLSV